jgi:D-alanine-D-alanine ligase-like ATP-grasp enzyme/acylphosphatase
MSNTFPNWLTKTMIQGAKGFNLDAYVMALEGWRRGLSLTWYYDPTVVTDLKIIGFHPLGKSFSLRSKDKLHHFYRSRGDMVANKAVKIVHDKHLAKSYFQKDDVPTPDGIMFNKNISNDEILKRVSGLNYPLVVKPVLGSLGKGVVTNIQNDAALFKAVDHVREDYDYEEIIVEEYVAGDEYRIYVVGDEVVAATRRMPANIMGDGISTIEQLIEAKNETRKENPYLANKLIKIDNNLLNYIETKNLTLESIPANDKVIQLRGQSNISSGGDPIDAMDDITDQIKSVAVRAVKSIPGLIHAGIDVIVGKDKLVVIEVNATAGIPMHLFPMKGKARNVPAFIMDYYFPETTGLVEDRTRIYFDYRETSELLRGRYAQEISLTDAPKGKLHTARYVVSGKVQKVGYRAWIKKQAVKSGLHGYIRNQKNGNVVVIVGSDDRDKVKKFKGICGKGPKKAKVGKIEELEWNSPIKIGFEIRKSR